MPAIPLNLRLPPLDGLTRGHGTIVLVLADDRCVPYPGWTNGLLSGDDGNSEWLSTQPELNPEKTF